MRHTVQHKIKITKTYVHMVKNAHSTHIAHIGSLCRSLIQAVQNFYRMYDYILKKRYLLSSSKKCFINIGSNRNIAQHTSN